MENNKWDGVTDADEILKALLFFVYDRDLELCSTTSYGDYGKYLCKHYKCLGAGNGGTYVIQGGAKYGTEPGRKFPAGFAGSPFIFNGLQRFIGKGKGTEEGGNGIKDQIQDRNRGKHDLHQQAEGKPGP